MKKTWKAPNLEELNINETTANHTKDQYWDGSVYCKDGRPHLGRDSQPLCHC